MEWDEIDHDLDFVKEQEQLVAFLQKQRKPLTTAQIKKKFEAKFLGDSLQVLETSGRILVTGSVLLPKYRYLRIKDQKPQRMRSCYHCGSSRPEKDFFDHFLHKLDKVCSTCRKFRGNRKSST